MELCEAFAFLMENIYVQFDGMVCQQIVGIPVGTDCAPLVADLFLYCCERDFVSDLRGSERFDLMDVFSGAARCLDDIFAIDGPEFGRRVPGVCPAGLRLSRADASDGEASFLGLNMGVIGGGVRAGVCGGRGGFGFLSLISHG